MGNLHLVTGHTGQTHVTAADMASLFEALIRNGQFVMSAGSNFAATAVSNNQIRIADGELLMQGRHIKLNPGAYVDLSIDNGDQGLQRHDLIVAQYTRNVETDIEDCNLTVIKGTPVSSDPVDPACSVGSINAGGAPVHQMPLYRVVLSGINIAEVVPLFEPQSSLFSAFNATSGALSDLCAELRSWLPASAKINGRLDDALLVDLQDEFAEINKPHIIGSSAFSAPEGLNGGVRVVNYISNRLISVEIHGIDLDGNAGVWINAYNWLNWTGWVRL